MKKQWIKENQRMEEMKKERKSEQAQYRYFR